MIIQQHEEPNTVKSSISKLCANKAHISSSTSKAKTIDTTTATTGRVGSLAGASPNKPLIAPYKKDARKIFVGGLGRTVNNHNFKAFFKQFGEVIDSVVMIDRGTNRHRGFGFVAFQDSSVAKTVLSKGNEGKPVPEGGWKRGQLDIFGRMCEVKVSEPKKNPYAGESGGNGQNVSSKSSCSSDTSAGIIPSDIQFQAGYQNTYDSQYGAWGDFVIAPLPPNADVYPPVVPGPVPAPSQLQGYSELNMCQVNPIRYYGNPYDGGMYETYPGAVYDQCVYNPYMYPYHGPVYAPPPQYYHLPPGGASEYGYCYSYTAVPQQDPVVPAGMTLPAEGNPQAAEGNPQAADPSFAQEGKEEKVEE